MPPVSQVVVCRLARIVARSSVESSTLFEVQGAVHTVLQGHQCELLSVL